MKLKDLREFINKLPVKFDEFEVVNGEIGQLKQDGEETFYYRVDKPVIAMYAMEDTEEICIFHQTEEEIKTITNGDTKES